MYRMQKIGFLAPLAPAAHPDSRLGIGFEKLDRAVFDPERAYDKLAAIGVRHVRIQSGWQRTETRRGVYDFGWLDAIVDNLIARGMQPWICLCYGNPLYDALAKECFGSVGCPPVKTAEQRDAWAAYVSATTAHFRGRVSAYEIWNEPDNKYCWKTGVDATEFGQFTVATAEAARAGDPDAYLIGGAICHDISGFLARALETTDMAKAVDAISYHEYVYDETLVRAKVRAIRGLTRLYNPALEIVQGESGTQSRAGGHGALRVGAWTPEKQAKLLLRHLVADLAADVKFTSYFTCVDMIEALKGRNGDKASYLDYGYFGVLSADFDEDGISTGDYTPKPSYYALQNLNSVLAGDRGTVELPLTVIRECAPLTGWAPRISAAELTYAGFVLANGAQALAYWHPANLMTTSFEGTVTLHMGLRGKPHLIDPMDGGVYAIPDEVCEDDGFGHFILRHMPVRDYPMFLVWGELPEMQ